MQEIKIKNGEVFAINGVKLMLVGTNLVRVKEDNLTIQNVKTEEKIEGEKRSVEIKVPCLHMESGMHEPN